MIGIRSVIKRAGVAGLVIVSQTGAVQPPAGQHFIRCEGMMDILDGAKPPKTIPRVISYILDESKKRVLVVQGSAFNPEDRCRGSANCNVSYSRSEIKVSPQSGEEGVDILTINRVDRSVNDTHWRDFPSGYKLWLTYKGTCKPAPFPDEAKQATAF